MGDERFVNFFHEVEAQDLAVFVHALHPTFTDRFPATDQLVNAIGFPIEGGLSVASIIGSGLLERCPGLRLAFSHGGGTFAYGLPRLENAWSGTWNGEPPAEGSAPSPVRQLLPQSPSTYARMLYYDTLLFDHRAIRFLMDLVGSTQVTVGTDYPFFPREQPIGRTLTSMRLSEQEWDNVSSKNCLRFLGLAVG